MKLALLSLTLVLAPMLAQPAIAAAVESCSASGIQYNCVTEEVTTREIPLYFASGNQTIQGQANTTRLDGVFDTWPSTIDAVTVPSDYGARVGCSIEMPVDILHLNLTGAEFAYTPSVTLSSIWESDSRPSVTYSNLVPAARYNVNATSAQIMNGASQFLFRGVVNISSTITLHVLDVRNETGTTVMRVGTTGNDEAAFSNGRVYYQLNFPFYSGHNYTFTEYVRFSDQTAPVDSLEMWVCPADAPAFGPTAFTSWPTDSVQGSVGFPPGYSMIMLTGTGAAGIENLLTGNQSVYSTYQLTMYARGRDGADPANVTFLVPIRHPSVLDVGVNVFARRSGNSDVVDQNYADAYTWIHNVTGSLVFNAALNHSAGSGYNEYAISIRVNLTNGSALAYNTFPPGQDWTANRDGSFLEVFRHGHQVVGITSSGGTDSYMVGWLPHFEVLDESNTTGPVTFNTAAFAGQAIARLLFALEYIPVVNIGVDVAGFLLGGEFSAAGLCHGFNNAISADLGTTAGTGGVPLICDEALLQDLQDTAAGVMTGLGCALAAGATTAAILARSLPAAIVATVAGVACGVDAAQYLPQWVIDAIEIVKKAIEKVGMILAQIMEWVEPIAVPVLVFLGLFVLIGVLIIPVKYALMGLMAPIAILMGHERPSKWPPFRKVRNVYFPIFTELVENRILKMGVAV